MQTIPMEVGSDLVTAHELAEALQFVATIHDAADERDLAAKVLGGLSAMLDTDSVSWHDLDLTSGLETTTVFEPAVMLAPRTRRLGALRTPLEPWPVDLVSALRLDLDVSAGPRRRIAVSAGRWTIPFGARERELAELLRPHLERALGHVRLRAGRRRSDAQIATLTVREREVLALVSDGRSNREIGAVLFIDARTVEKHVEHIRAKLGARSRTHAAAVFGAARHTDD